MADGPGCNTCGAGQAREPRLYVVNAFHDVHTAQIENLYRTEEQRLTKSSFNGLNIPADYRALVALVETEERKRPINVLEIACHGTGFAALWGVPDEGLHQDLLQGRITQEQYEAQITRQQFEESDAPGMNGQLYFRNPDPSRTARAGALPSNQVYDRDPQGALARDGDGELTVGTGVGYRRLRSPGAAIVGTSAELVSGRTIHFNEHGHGTLSERLARAVIPGGRIIWQACNLADSMAPHMSFLAAFSARAAGRQVSAASGETLAGTTGIQGSRWILRKDGTREHQISATFRGQANASGGIVQRVRPPR